MSQTTITAGSITDLLTIVPSLIGFQPADSVVIVGLKPSSQIHVTLRYDLPSDADQLISLAKHAMAVLDSADIGTLVAVIYGTKDQGDPVADVLAFVAARSDITIRDTLRVAGGRYWSYSCAAEDCCPAAGTPFTPGTPPAELGVPVLADRDQLAESIAPLRDGAGFMQLAIEHAAHTDVATALTAVQTLIARYQAGEDYGTETEMATALVGLRHLRVRDDAWSRMDPEFTGAHLRLWTELTRRAQPGYVAAPASLLAFVAWQSGNGALANVALDRALADNPHYSMAQLLRQVITAGAPPSLARLPMTPEEVAASYAEQDAAGIDPDASYGLRVDGQYWMDADGRTTWPGRDAIALAEHLEGADYDDIVFVPADDMPV